MIFKPAIYSKHQTTDAIKKALEAAPHQKAGSKEAFAGKVFELCEAYGGPVATLSELHEVYGMDAIIIQCRDGEIPVLRKEDGSWYAPTREECVEELKKMLG